ncbi:MAG TPA: HTTM domain-containing protein [Polyangiales bacterium]|nr:HTTM domain-containing protein [Polyangiales bacterium]
MRGTGFVDARFYAPLGPARLATLRVLTGAFAVIYFAVRAPVMASFHGFRPEQFQPVGFAQLLSAPLPGWLVTTSFLAAIGFGVAFTLGAWFRVSGPVFALLALWVTSYRNSWGMIFHTDNLLVVHVAVLALTDAAATLSLDARDKTFIGRRRFAAAPAPEPHGRYGWPVRLICALTVLAYFIAGVAKLKASGVAWMHGEILRNYIAFDALRKSQVGSLHSPLGAWLVQYAWPFPIIGAGTLALELLGPLALLHRRAARLWVFGVYGFHVGVLLTMAIAFPYPLSGVAFASFFECERLWRWKGRAHGCDASR